MISSIKIPSLRKTWYIPKIRPWLMFVQEPIQGLTLIFERAYFWEEFCILLCKGCTFRSVFSCFHRKAGKKDGASDLQSQKTNKN